MFSAKRSIAAATLALVVSISAAGATFQNQTLSKITSSSCGVPPASTAFLTTDGHVYLYFEASVTSADKLSAIWYGPDGQQRASESWNAVSGAYCFLGASFDFTTYSPSLGPYRVDVLNNGSVLFSLPFTISAPGTTGGNSGGAPQITGLSRSQFTPGNIGLSVFGSNFQNGSTLTVDYILNGAIQWNVARGLPLHVDNQGQADVQLQLPDPGEFQISVQNPNGQTSAPVVLFIGLGGYKLPFPAGETWTTTQGNNEQGNGFDHNGHLAYAYDFSAGPGHCVVAMKGGFAYTYDSGLGQESTNPNSPGNYIMIDHGNGEYSYYFHLKTSTFVVKNGQYVEQGQGLAVVGNSGYTLPAGGGYHVHVEVTKSSSLPAQTVPFLFNDVNSSNPFGSPPGQPTRPNTYTSQNSSAYGSCGSTSSTLQFGTSGVVSAGAWWNSSFSVPSGTSSMRINLAWQGSSNLVLYAVSPTGTVYGYGGDTLGNPTYYYNNPQVFNIVQPAAGSWTIWVLGWVVPAGNQTFSVSVTN